MLRIDENNKRKQHILHPDVLSPLWLMYSFRTVQMNLHLMFTGWISRVTESNGIKRFYALAYLLSKFGSEINRAPILHGLSQTLCSHSVTLPMCMLNLGTGPHVQKFQVSLYSNWSDTNHQVLCIARPQVFQQIAITIETRHNLEIQFHIACDQWKYLTKQTTPWCAVSSGINSHMEILPLSMRLQIEGENQSSFHLYF